MKPYLITSTKLITYSGRIVPIELSPNIFYEPIRKVKDKILDSFAKMGKESKDPFVRVDYRIKPVFEL